MRFGLFGGARTDPGEQASDSRIYSDYIDYICEAEELGFHSVFLVEHHFTGFGQVSATLNFLTYLAAKTTKMRLGTAVLVLPWHNPALLAEQAATLDLLSNGRFDFGVGKGYRWGEFHGFCIPMEEAEERYQETLAFLPKDQLTVGTYHLAVRAKFMAMTVGSFDMTGINCVLRRHASALDRRVNMIAYVTQHTDALPAEVDVVPPRAEWNTSPLNDSIPSSSGKRGTANEPMADTRVVA